MTFYINNSPSLSYSILSQSNLWIEPQQFTSVAFGGESIGVTYVIFAESPYTILPWDEFIICDCTGGDLVLNLPPCTAMIAFDAGRKLIFVKVDNSAHTATIIPNGTDVIEGFAQKVLSSQYDKIGLINSATNDWIDLGTGGGI